MNYNPYSPPTAPHAGASGGDPRAPYRAPDLDLSEVFRAGWDGYARNWLPLTLAWFVAMLLSTVPLGITLVVTGAMTGLFTMKITPGATTLPPAMMLAMVPTVVVGIVIWSYFHAGIWRMTIAAARGEATDISAVFSGGPVFLKMVGVTLLTNAPSILMNVSSLLVPGDGTSVIALVVTAIGGLAAIAIFVLNFLGLYLAPLFVVDRGLGPIDALRSSWNSVAGNRLMFLLIGICDVLFYLAGGLACCVGMIVTGIAASVIVANVYVRLSGPQPETRHYAQ